MAGEGSWFSKHQTLTLIDFQSINYVVSLKWLLDELKCGGRAGWQMSGAGGEGLPCLEGDACDQLRRRLRLDASDSDAVRSLASAVARPLQAC